MKRFPQLTLLFTVLLIAGGCSSFNREWNKAGELPPPSDDMTGRWQGTWKSEASGHTDKLRCIVTRGESGFYQAQFHAKYHGILSFGYTVPLKVEKTNDTFQYSGEADLGSMAGGTYQYKGHANATTFFSTYSSKDDHGTFQMSRPEPAAK